MEQNFFDRLLELPLFQGIGRDEFIEIVERIRFGFQKKAMGACIVRQGDPCDSLYFIVKGNVCSSQVGDDHTYVLSEWFESPLVLQPERLFGLNTRYTKTFRAETEVQVFEVGKRAISDILFHYPTFRFNYLNIISTQVQQARRRLWQKRPATVCGRFAFFVADRSIRLAGRKELKIGMKQLAGELDATRLRVSKALNALEEEGFVKLSRKMIEMPSFEKLLQRKDWPF